ncbi:hypothetical protein GQ55_3G418700 [Panicum hallii var. hallii]|uniref:Uncharacterized protein n=1 Tax=Panicum hallii var. hallii TaxID=1504633 RepID=A0A2T7EHD1_9POAL|nr:hypothetical protein GQ55_3G418700 [Panicum hallii var. hallii]
MRRPWPRAHLACCGAAIAVRPCRTAAPPQAAPLARSSPRGSPRLGGPPAPVDRLPSLRKAKASPPVHHRGLPACPVLAAACRRNHSCCRPASGG